MPFIRGRYHVNPIMGEALEAAREAEAASLALQKDAHGAHDQADGFASPHASDREPAGPIHRVEIEAAEMVPGPSDRGERGFVARVHRIAPSSVTMSSGAKSGSFRRDDEGPVHDSAHLGCASAPETHVFSNHRDLLNFLHDELAKGKAPR
jgi:hypothetical protein